MTSINSKVLSENFPTQARCEAITAYSLRRVQMKAQLSQRIFLLHLLLTSSCLSSLFLMHDTICTEWDFHPTTNFEVHSLKSD